MERLERIKDWYEKIGTLPKGEVDWLIEQSEKVEKLIYDLQYEKENRMFDKAEIERLKEEIRKYKIAITKAMDKCKWSNMDTYEILEKVLKT